MTTEREEWYGDRKYNVALMEHNAAMRAIEEARRLRQVLIAAVLANGGVLRVDRIQFDAAGGDLARFSLDFVEDIMANNSLLIEVTERKP